MTKIVMTDFRVRSACPLAKLEKFHVLETLFRHFENFYSNIIDSKFFCYRSYLLGGITVYCSNGTVEAMQTRFKEEVRRNTKITILHKITTTNKQY